MSVINSNSLQSTEPRIDQLPRFAIGHLSIEADDVERLTEFYTGVGLRLVVNMGRASILELRGGTHLILRSGRGGQGALDLIVDDIDDTHAVLEHAGAQVSEIRRGSPHDSFVAADPEGNDLQVHSTHAIGRV